MATTQQIPLCPPCSTATPRTSQTMPAKTNSPTALISAATGRYWAYPSSVTSAFLQQPSSCVFRSIDQCSDLLDPTSKQDGLQDIEHAVSAVPAVSAVSGQTRRKWAPLRCRYFSECRRARRTLHTRPRTTVPRPWRTQHPRRVYLQGEETRRPTLGRLRFRRLEHRVGAVTAFFDTRDMQRAPPLKNVVVWEMRLDMVKRQYMRTCCGARK